MSPLMVSIIGISAFLVGFVICFVVVRTFVVKEVQAKAQQRSQQILKDARREAQDIEKEAQRKSKDVVDKARRDFEREHESKLEQAKRSERKAKDLEDKAKEEYNQARSQKEAVDQAKLRAERDLQEAKRLMDQATNTENQYKSKLEDIRVQLEKIAGMTQKEAIDNLTRSLEDEAKIRSARSVRQIEEKAKEESEQLAKRVISIAISRYSSDYVSERTTSAITLPNDEIKGKLIGREGRNIRAIEAATGCDLIIDDTPETVIVSCFDPVRRHIGKQVLEQLIADGRVHPSRIEEAVEKVTKNVNKSIKEAGEKALLDLEIVSMHPELVKTIGQLQFRYSYSQNQYHHVREVGFMCGMMANELGLDAKKARRAGLLHDIGKALTHEIEGSHAVIGADLCEKFGEDPEIVYAIRAHHEDVPPKSWLDYLVIGADAISAARPGARQEQMESYVKRLRDLENIASQHGGVERAFAINAGREVRVMVENNRINDEQALVLSNDIAKEIENSMAYPGQIKVTVIRETRATAYAK